MFLTTHTKYFLGEIAQLRIARKEFINVLIARDITAGVPFSGENVWANIGRTF